MFHFVANKLAGTATRVATVTVTVAGAMALVVAHAAPAS